MEWEATDDSHDEETEDGERSAAEATRDALAAVGARDTRLESFPTQGWSWGSAAIHAGETTQDCTASESQR